MNVECPNCGMDNAYCDGVNYVCPDCDYEWGCPEIDFVDDDFDSEFENEYDD